MCRIVGYMGQPLALDRLLYHPEHSLVHQSYQPKEMTAGLLNADGFGIGWHGSAEPFIYRSVLPIWNDANLPDLSRYVASEAIVASVRSATPGIPVSLSNCPPFRHQQILMVHNGAIDNFKQTLLTPLRDYLSARFARPIEGCTDSEHLFALILEQWGDGLSLEAALSKALSILLDLGGIHDVAVSANVILCLGDRLIACRAGNKSPQPSLYWLQNDATISGGVAIASEPLWPGKWQPFPEHTLLTVESNLSVTLQSL